MRIAGGAVRLIVRFASKMLPRRSRLPSAVPQRRFERVVTGW